MFFPLTANSIDSFSISPLLPQVSQLHLRDTHEVKRMPWERALHMF